METLTTSNFQCDAWEHNEKKESNIFFSIKIMCSVDVIFAIRIIAIWLLFVDRKCVDATFKRNSFRPMRPKAISFSPFLTASPPRLTAAPKFQSMDFDIPPFFGSQQQSYSQSQSQSHTPSTDYGPPTTMKAVIHKHIYVHVPPPDPEPIQLR